MKILVVDDNPDNVELVCQILEEEYEVIKAANGCEALELAKSERPYIILLDVMMPVMDGYEVLRQLKEDDDTQNIPVLFLTARYKDTDRVVAGLDQGAFDYITKPIEDEVLLARVGVAVRARKAEDEVRQIHAELDARVLKRTDELAKANSELNRQINERIQAEKERDKMEALLRHAEKLEAIGSLAGGIAHEFNNILTIIIGYTEMALEKYPGVSELSEILSASERARTVVGQMLSFSQQAHIEPRPTEPHIIVKEAVKALRTSLPPDVVIQEDIDPECGTIIADSTQIYQVLKSLVNNAVYAMDQKGTVGVSLKLERLEKKDLAHRPDMKEGMYVKLSVSDTGPGISPEIVEKIFDPFFTTKEVNEGKGLGLSVAHGIIMSHRGMISVESHQGKGTTFHVYFTSVEDKEKQADESTDPVVGGNERILLVDDEKLLVDMLKKMLTRMGYCVTTKISATEAFETFASHPDKFDLVITDLSMPGMSGVELIQQILTIRPDIPVILCTGFNRDNVSLDIEKPGIKALLRKPFPRLVLARKIREVLDS